MSCTIARARSRCRGGLRFVFITSVLCISALCVNWAVARAAEPLLHVFSAVALSPDGKLIASIESDEPTIEGQKTHQRLMIRHVDGSGAVSVPLSCGDDVDCVPSSPAWSPDSTSLAFVVRAPHKIARTIERVDATARTGTILITFTGTLVDLRYGHDGRLAVLATPGAHKEVGATQAAAPLLGEIGAHPDEQRIAIVDNGSLHFASPPDLYVYEYDWLPTGTGFVGTAAHGDGDDNWWIAKLYAFEHGTARIVYTPRSAQEQLASPRVSPDGAHVAFIAGIMSDFGSTGGDVVVVPMHGGSAVNLTPKAPASATALAWSKRVPGRLVRVWLHAAESGIAATDSAGAPAFTHSVGQTSFSPGSAPFALATDDSVAVIQQDFRHPPEIAVGPVDGPWRVLTHANSGVAAATNARAIAWRDDGFAVDGWLLEPLAPPAGKLPMITMIHGGPSAAYRPQFVGRGTVRALLRAGYAVFEPNPRGSFGAGEAFTRANVRDFGYGDLRDILSGIDAVEKIAPIDEHRLGVTGYSYGGYMTMWTVTQTHRFAAAVAGAGISDWLSYYGENGIDRWMIPFFGASVYDDPAIYAHSAPITFIKNVRTPTFEYVGERDVECPMPQTQEFWHALATFNIPTEFVVYAGEGHGIRDPQHRADAENRTLAWFAKYLK